MAIKINNKEAERRRNMQMRVRRGAFQGEGGESAFSPQSTATQ